MSKINGNGDGPGGRNDGYKIGSRTRVPREKAVQEVKNGRHPDSHVVTVNGTEYVRGNPDNSKKRQCK
jgi:hypothetical protein